MKRYDQKKNSERASVNLGTVRSLMYVIGVPERKVGTGTYGWKISKSEEISVFLDPRSSMDLKGKHKSTLKHIIMKLFKKVI